MKKVCMIMGALMLLCAQQASAAGKNPWSQSYSLEANGKYEQAAALIAPFLDGNKQSEFAQLRYGWLNYLQGNYNDAIRAYKRAMELNPRSFDARLGIALPLMAQSRWKSASLYLLQVIDQSPMNYLANVRLMACEEGMRQWKTLESHAVDMAAHYPSDTTVLVYLARAHAWQGEDDQAVAAYRRVLIRYPGNTEALSFVNKHTHAASGH